MIKESVLKVHEVKLSSEVDVLFVALKHIFNIYRVLTYSWCLLYSRTLPGSAIPFSVLKGSSTKSSFFSLDFADLYVSSSHDKSSG